MYYRFTSESVAEGHPDKLCDQVSDAILDACLAQDPLSRVAVETLVKKDTVVLAGEITTNSDIDYDRLVRTVIREIGYVDPSDPFHADGVRIINLLGTQAQEIKEAVDAKRARAEALETAESKSEGAGDQGLMFGYATDETPELMPMPILLAHRLAEGLAYDRRNGESWLGPDAKTQVTVGYRDNVPYRIENVLVSTQHAAGVPQGQIEAYVREALAPRILGDWYRPDVKTIVNPSGSFVQGGPSADAGLTGRKIIVDTYGGMGRHGGGAFSGKDPSKVDRSGAYFARFVARQIVEAGLAQRAEVQVSYAIGRKEPFSLYVSTFGTGDDIDALAFAQQFDFQPASIIAQLALLKPIYRQTAAYGHFGKPYLSWEQPTVTRAA
ncbi:MAG: methionine adenosyltransferase [Bacteroidota bacterium]